MLHMSSLTSGSLRFGETRINITKSNWIHVAYVIDSNKITSYVNGTFNDQKTLTGLNLLTANSKDLYIGYQGNDWYPLYGTLDDFRIYQRALTNSDILALYHLGS